MRKLNHISAVILSLSMLTSLFPITARAENTDIWKFDFGYGDSVADGYIGVTPDMSCTSNIVDGVQFGFLGIDENSYSESGRWDGYSVVKGQQIVLAAGGEKNGTADSDYIAVPDKSNYLPENASEYEGRYPIRFAMKVERKTYYTVKATLANSSASENAVISLQSEKRHIIDNNIVLNPNETKTYTFNVDVEDFRYKSDKTAYEDDMLNIVVSGKNAALASLEIEKHGTKTGKMSSSSKDNPANIEVNDGITLWCCDDSTGCDQGASIPYFELQNYAGVCQELSKYVPDNIAVSNQGEGGLASNDTAHRDQCFLKEGDYLYVQYGHNEDGADGYKSRLGAYYDKAHAAGAKLIIVSPIERHNTWNKETQTYGSGFTSIIEAGKSFVDEKIASGANDIAFVDLNSQYILWMNEEIKRINNINSEISKEKAIEFYYRSSKGSKIDTTHINDAGADQGARAFFDAAQKVYDSGKNAELGTNAKIQADVLEPLLSGWHNERSAYTISDEVINTGTAPNTYWDTPVTNTVPYKYNIAVTDTQQENNELKSVTVRVQNDLPSYARVVVRVTSNGETTKYYSKQVVDNTADLKGTLKTFTEFTTTDAQGAETVNVSISDGAVCTVQAYEADLADWSVNENIPYSTEYTIKKVIGTALTEDGADISDWKDGGSAVRSNTAVTNPEDRDAPYINAQKTGSGSCVFVKMFDTNITDGIANIKLKMRYTSGLVNLCIAESTNNGVTYYKGGIVILNIYNGKVNIGNQPIKTNISDTSNTINTGDWFDIDCIVDYDMGTASVSVAGSDYTAIDVGGLQNNNSYMIPAKCFGLLGDAKASDGYDCDIKDISITTIERDNSLPMQTVSAEYDTSMGNVEINGEKTDSAEVVRGSEAVLKAIPNDGYEFINWTDENGEELSSDGTYTVLRVYEGFSATANFKSVYGEGYTVSRIDDFTEDFEGETNIFGVTQKSSLTDIPYSSSILPTGDGSVFGNVLVLGHDTVNFTKTLSEPIVLNERQRLEFSLDTFNNWWTNNNQKQKEYSVSILNSEGDAVAGFTYFDYTGMVTSVTAGGTVYNSANNNGFEDFQFCKSNYIYNYNFTDKKNAGTVSFEILCNGNVTVKFSNGGLTEEKSYNGLVSGEVTIKSLSIQKKFENNNTNNRTAGIDNLKALVITSPETHGLTFNAVDISTNNTVTPTIIVKDSDNNVVEDLTSLYGTYTYTAELDGYHTVTGKVTVKDKEETVELEMVPTNLSVLYLKNESGDVLDTAMGTDNIIYYPIIIEKDGVYYKTETNTEKQNGMVYSYGKYFSEPSNADITYSVLENCVYYAETEDILGGDVLNGTAFSQGKSQYQNSNSIIINLPKGTYGFYVSGYAANNTHVYVTPPSGTRSDGTISKGRYGIAESKFTTSGGDFKISNNYSGSFQMDYIYVVKLPDEYTVTFNTDGGSEMANATIVDGEKVAMPDDPIKTGHTFVKWQLNGIDYDFDTAVTGDITLTAVWSKNKYTATFNLTGGNIDGSTENVEVETEYNTVPSIPPNPQKTGYTFTGWSPAVAAITEDTTYTAQWTENSYTISKNMPENGSVTLSKTSANMGEEITVTVTPSDGYKLASITVNGEITEIKNNAYTFTMPAENVEIIVEFERKAVKSISITGPSTVTNGQTGTYTATVTAEDDTDVTELYKSDIVWSLTGNSVNDTKIEKDTENGNKADLTLNENEMGTNKKITVIVAIGEQVGNKEISIEDEPYYHIDIAVVTGGTIKLTSPDSVKANSTVTFTVEPSNGYHVVADSVKVNNGDIAVSENEGVYSFIMPAETATITAEFEADIPIIQKYTVIITGDEGIENVKLGTMNGKKADNTYTFTDIVAGTYTFDVIYAAGYEKSDLSSESITVSESKTTETISSQKKKFTVIFKIEGQDDIKVSNIEYNTAPTGAPSLTDTATRHYLGWVKGTDTSTDVINLADERITEDTVYTAKYETLTPQPEKIWLELLPKFKKWLQIEKITVENEVTLSASKKDDSEFDEADKFSVYVAVYDDDILQSVKKVYWAEEENNTFKASISEPDGENYKVFIWTSNYEPITEAITSLTTEKQTVLNK